MQSGTVGGINGRIAAPTLVDSTSDHEARTMQMGAILIRRLTSPSRKCGHVESKKVRKGIRIADIASIIPALYSSIVFNELHIFVSMLVAPF